MCRPGELAVHGLLKYAAAVNLYLSKPRCVDDVGHYATIGSAFCFYGDASLNEGNLIKQGGIMNAKNLPLVKFLDHQEVGLSSLGSARTNC